MIFLSYDFVLFAVLFYSLYVTMPGGRPRTFLIVLASLAFQLLYGGVGSVLVTAVLASLTFLAGRAGSRRALWLALTVAAASLILFKYSAFVIANLVSALSPADGAAIAAWAGEHLPAVPLGISFFTFEFVHYLVDRLQGAPAIRRPSDFAAFIFFWPTMVAGPIKRYEQFVPALRSGTVGPAFDDLVTGLARVSMGFVKKWAADNLTASIDHAAMTYAEGSTAARWVFILLLGVRIFLDFSGYSDMAIGFARLMGIAVPENFDRPYLATSPMDFWRRWHISLSTWIRDYIYIPLGGNRLGTSRRIFNALAAMALCGLWHGAAWNFVVWGFYHGVGLAIGTLLERRYGHLVAGAGSRALASEGGPADLTHYSATGVGRSGQMALMAVCWLATTVFVCIGWLLFFFPLERAAEMIVLLVRP